MREVRVLEADGGFAYPMSRLHEPKRPDPETEWDLDYCPKCGLELETHNEDEEFLRTYRACPEHGSVTIDFQDTGRDSGYGDFEGAIRSPEWIRCPKCSHLGVEIPEAVDGYNVYFECPECEQRGIVS